MKVEGGTTHRMGCCRERWRGDVDWWRGSRFDVIDLGRCADGRGRRIAPQRWFGGPLDCHGVRCISTAGQQTCDRGSGFGGRGCLRCHLRFHRWTFRDGWKNTISRSRDITFEIRGKTSPWPCSPRMLAAGAGARSLMDGPGNRCVVQTESDVDVDWSAAVRGRNLEVKRILAAWVTEL